MVFLLFIDTIDVILSIEVRGNIIWELPNTPFWVVM